MLAPLLVLSGCGGEQYEPTYEARVHIEPVRYHVLVTMLDVEMGKLGLTRFRGSEGMRRIYKERSHRDLVFFAYQSKLEDKLAFLTVDDFLKVGVMHIWVFPEALPETGRDGAIARIDAVLAKFGTRLGPFKRTELKG